MALKVGIQLYSVRDEMKKDPINAIRQVAEIGYKNLEFASSNADTDPGVGFGVSVEDMQKLLKETGANLISGHIRPINEETIDPMIAYHTQVGTKYLGQSADFYTGYDQLMERCEYYNWAGKKALRARHQVPHPQPLPRVPEAERQGNSVPHHGQYRPELRQL